MNKAMPVVTLKDGREVVVVGGAVAVRQTVRGLCQVADCTNQSVPLTPVQHGEEMPELVPVCGECNTMGDDA